MLQLSTWMIHDCEIAVSMYYDKLYGDRDTKVCGDIRWLFDVNRGCQSCCSLRRVICACKQVIVPFLSYIQPLPLPPMWEPNEQLLLRAPVLYKKNEGTLFVTPRRIAWQQQGTPQLNPSILYNSISGMILGEPSIQVSSNTNQTVYNCRVATDARKSCQSTVKDLDNSRSCT